MNVSSPSVAMSSVTVTWTTAVVAPAANVAVAVVNPSRSAPVASVEPPPVNTTSTVSPPAAATGTSTVMLTTSPSTAT